MNNKFSWKDHKLIFLLIIIPIGIIIYNTGRYWDIFDTSYILENAYFISVGKIPYRDFVLNITPGSFFIQAFIIKFIGSTLYSQIIYCCIISVLTFFLTYRILFFFNNDKWLNTAIALPVAVTGGYGILSIPFYDPDCIFFVLVSLFILLISYNRSFPVLLTFIAGISAFLPFFFKQNIGLAYLVSIHFVLIVSLIYKNEGLNLKKYLWFLTGTITAAAIFFIYLILTSSYNEFYNCIIGFSFGNYLKTRSASFTQNISVKVLEYTFVILLIFPVIKYFRLKKIWLYSLIILLAGAPFYLIPMFKLIIRDLDYYVEFLIILPIAVNIFVIASAYSLFKMKEIPILIRTLPIVILGVIYAVIMSQGYWISHYGIWPLFSILFACLFLFLLRSIFKSHITLLRWIFIVNSILITVSMFMYIKDNQFLYQDLSKTIYHSETKNLKGFSYPGDIVPNMDNLFKFVQAEIPTEDAVIIIPHEDPFYLATGRYPHFPVLMNDFTLDIIPFDEIIRKTEAYNVRWMIIKTGNVMKVLNENSIKSWKYLIPIINHLKKTFKLYKELPGYEIYKKAEPIL